MTEDTPHSGGGRQLPTADELRIWRDFIETAEALRAELGGPAAERDLAVAGRLRGAARAQRGAGPTDAVVGARRGDRLGAQPAVPPPRPHGEARARPSRGVRHRQPGGRGRAEHARRRGVPAPRRCRTCAPSASCSSTRSHRSRWPPRATSPPRSGSGSRADPPVVAVGKRHVEGQPIASRSSGISSKARNAAPVGSSRNAPRPIPASTGPAMSRPPSSRGAGRGRGAVVDQEDRAPVRGRPGRVVRTHRAHAADHPVRRHPLVILLVGARGAGAFGPVEDLAVESLLRRSRQG